MPGPDRTQARREALIVAADRYEDRKLRALRAPARDAKELARVLGDSAIGDFSVDVSLNEPDHVVRRKLSEFFRDRGRDDLLVLHVSCHGLKDEDGTLYFASSNTAVDHLEATAIPSEFVNRQMTKSRSRRIILLLDCCFGGAFARGLVHRAGESVAIKEEFEGQGRVVLTASRAMEYAFEGESREGDAQPSIFTSAIVQGLESGEADRDRDSRVSIDELYDYVYDRVRDATPNQTPSKWTFDVHGDLYVARSPFRAPEPEPVQLPVELRAAMDSPFAHVRAGAVQELARILEGSDVGLASAAHAGLEKLVGDDSRRVSDAAGRALAGEAAVPEPASPTVAPRAAEPARHDRVSSVLPVLWPTSRVARVLARAADWKDVLAVAGAALVLLGYFGTASWESTWRFSIDFNDDIWSMWSPPEALATVAVALWAAFGSRRRRLRDDIADGLLAGVGGMTCIAMIAFVDSSFEFRSTAQLTMLGGLMIVAAAGSRLVTRHPSEATLPRRTVALAATGAALALSPLFVDFETGDSLVGGWGAPFYLEVLIGGLTAMLALVLLVVAPQARLRAAGALIAIGVLVALHLIGLAIQFAHNDGWSFKDLRFGAPLGVVGGLLLVGSGLRVVRRNRGCEPDMPAQASANLSMP